MILINPIFNFGLKMENPFEIILEKLEHIQNAISRIEKKSAADEQKFLNIDQVSEFIGLSKFTIYGLTHKRIIPHYKNGKRLCFKKSEIADWMASGKVVTNEEMRMNVHEYLFKNSIQIQLSSTHYLLKWN